MAPVRSTKEIHCSFSSGVGRTQYNYDLMGQNPSVSSKVSCSKKVHARQHTAGLEGVCLQYSSQKTALRHCKAELEDTEVNSLETGSRHRGSE